MRICSRPLLFFASDTCDTVYPSGKPLSTALKPHCFAKLYFPVNVALSANINDRLAANFNTMMMDHTATVE